MTDREKLDRSLDMLYKARWNVPQAAAYCGLTRREMMDLFSREATVGRLLPQKLGAPTSIQLDLGL